KTGPLSTRTVSPEQTDLRLRDVIRTIPISRISDLTPLDYLRLPVFSVVTPLARDLTTHLGKGADVVGARVSALMEAVERVSAETLPQSSLRVSSFEALRRNDATPAVNPLDFDLPSDTAYTSAGSFHWIEGFDLLAQQPVWIPADLAKNPPDEGILRHVDTNGL